MKPIIYTTPTCASCHMVEKYFNRINQDFTKIDLSELRDLQQELFTKVGSLRVPIVQYGSKFTVGYNPGELAKLLTSSQA